MKEQYNLIVNVVVPNNCQLKRSKLDSCCCEVHCQVKEHYNLHHKFYKDSILQPVQLGELDQFAWEEVNSYSLDTTINVGVLQGMEQI